MIPGAFKSPTPSREASPIELVDSPYTPSSCSTSSSTPSPCTPSRNRARSSPFDFTAIGHKRHRPRFAETQSEPVLPIPNPLSARFEVGRATNGTTSPDDGQQPAPDRRRVSDPAKPRSKKLSSSNGIQKTRGKVQCRATSNPIIPTPLKAQQSTSSEETSPDPPTETLEATTPKHISPNRPGGTKIPRLADGAIRTELRKDLNDDDGKGVLYMFSDPDHPTLAGRIKIGSCAREQFDKRIEEHRRDCGIKPTNVQYTEEVAFCRRFEKLVHLDLADECSPWSCNKCKNKKPHAEYFDVCEDDAWKTIKKWEKFMNEQKPYGRWSRQLNPIWTYLLEVRKRNYVETDDEGIEVEGLDHEARREHWNYVLSPPTNDDRSRFTRYTRSEALDMYSSVALQCWRNWQCFPWQLSTVGYGIVVLFLCRNLIASTACAIVMLCACNSIANGKGISPSKKARGKGGVQAN